MQYFFIAYGAAKPFAAYLLSRYSASVQENAAMFIGMVIFTILNYLSQRFIGFKCGIENAEIIGKTIKNK